MYLLDSDVAPVITEATLVVSLAVTARSLKRPGSRTSSERECWPSTSSARLSAERAAERVGRRHQPLARARPRRGSAGAHITFSSGSGDEFALNEVVVERAHAGHMCA